MMTNEIPSIYTKAKKTKPKRQQEVPRKVLPQEEPERGNASRGSRGTNASDAVKRDASIDALRKVEGVEGRCREATDAF